MSARKIFVTDLDDTLLNQDGTLPAILPDFLSKLDDAGIEFIVATARSPQNVSELFASITRPFRAICLDGGVVGEVHTQKFTAHHELLVRPDLASQIVNDFSEQSASLDLFVFCSSLQDYSVFHFGSVPRKQLGAYSAWFGDARPIHCKSPRDIDEIVNYSVRSISFLDSPSEIARHYCFVASRDWSRSIEFIKYAETRFSACREAELEWLDIFNIDTNKGNGLNWVTQSCDEEPEVVVAGNGYNDISMFAIANKSLCPINSVPEVRSSATMPLSCYCGEALVGKLMSLLSSGELFNAKQV